MNVSKSKFTNSSKGRGEKIQIIKKSILTLTNILTNIYFYLIYKI